MKKYREFNIYYIEQDGKKTLLMSFEFFTNFVKKTRFSIGAKNSVKYLDTLHANYIIDTILISAFSNIKCEDKMQSSIDNPYVLICALKKDGKIHRGGL